MMSDDAPKPKESTVRPVDFSNDYGEVADYAFQQAADHGPALYREHGRVLIVLTLTGQPQGLQIMSSYVTRDQLTESGRELMAAAALELVDRYDPATEAVILLMTNLGIPSPAQIRKITVAH
jgi:hypothetical protein